MFLLYVALIACTDDKQEVVLPSTVPADAMTVTDADPAGNSNPVAAAPVDDPTVPFGDGCQATHVWQQQAPRSDSGVTVNSTVETDRIVDEILVDFLRTDGEVAYGIKCSSKTISADVPSNLGTVRLAVFIDSDRNGPSRSDLQGFSQLISITTSAVTVAPISLSTTPVPLFNFAE